MFEERREDRPKGYLYAGGGSARGKTCKACKLSRDGGRKGAGAKDFRADEAIKRDAREKIEELSFRECRAEEARLSSARRQRFIEGPLRGAHKGRGTRGRKAEQL